jgi:hypothetical protein
MHIWTIKPTKNSIMPELSFGVVVARDLKAAEQIAELNQATVIDGSQLPWAKNSSAFLAWNFH